MGISELKNAFPNVDDGWGHPVNFNLSAGVRVSDCKSAPLHFYAAYWDILLFPNPRISLNC